jgi:hypothetical protein
MTSNHIPNFFSGITKLYTEQTELAAIWLDKPLNTPFGKTFRLTADSLVKVEDGKLVDFAGEPSHKVIACFGTLVNQFELTLLDLKTNEPLQLSI